MAKRKSEVELIAQRITELREKAGFTITSFANHIGVSERKCLAYEQGKITVRELVIVTDGLEIEFQSFFKKLKK